MPFLIETITIEDCVQVCTSLGLQFIELNMNFPQCQLQELSPEKLNKIRNETGIYFTIHLDENLNISDFNLEVKEAYKRTVLGTISLAKEIEAPIINMHLAKGIYITLPNRKEFLFQQYESYYTQSMLEFKEMCEKAIGKQNIKVAIENTDGFFEHEKEAIKLLLSSKVFGLTLDIGHSHAVRNIDMPFYENNLNKLIHMHAHDAQGTKNHLAFGDGEIDLAGKLLLARKSGIRVVLETKTIEALTTTVHLLSKYQSV